MKSKKKMFNDNAHDCLKTVLLIAQYFGSFPVNKLRKSNIKELSFSWYSIQTISSFLLGIMYFLCGSLAFAKVFSTGLVHGIVLSPVFYISVSIANIIFVLIARNWRAFMSEVCKVEEIIIRNYPCTINLPRKIRIIAAVFITTTISI